MVSRRAGQAGAQESSEMIRASDHKYFLARRAIAPTTLRGNASREGRREIFRFLSKLQTPNDPTRFATWLDDQTVWLAKRSAIEWGASRKALNLFLRDLRHDSQFGPGLAVLAPELEIPLDSVTMKAIRQNKYLMPDVRKKLSVTTIKGLTRSLSFSFQEAAKVVAKKRKVDRVDLDVLFWARSK